MQYLKTLIVLLSISLFTFAQGRRIQPEIYLGPSFGINKSKIQFNPTVSQDFLQGLKGGLVVRYIADKNFGLQCELNYSQQGWAEKNGLYSRQLDYIELPFLTHVYFGNKSRFFFNIGPKFSYLVSEKTISDNTNASTDYQNVTPIQNAFDYGLCTGIGYLVNIKGNVIQIDTRAHFSLSDVYSNDKKDFFDASNNFYISANIAWLLKIK